MRLDYRVRAGMAIAAMAIAADGCVTHPPPVAESVVAGSSQPSPSGGAGGGAAPAATDIGAAADIGAAPGAIGGGAAPTATGGGAAAPANGGSATARATAGSAPIRTTEERRAALDKQLNDSLGAFDARLRQEQQKIAQDRDARQATVAATTTSDASDPASQELPAGAHGGKLVKARTERAGDLKSDKSDGGSATVAGNGASANVIPDGNDDDIVARRLRKAAEQETDPELKDKLWQEYVEYKKNTQVR